MDSTLPQEGDTRVSQRYVRSGQPRAYADSEYVFIGYPERFTGGEWKREEMKTQEFEENWLPKVNKTPRKPACMFDPYLKNVTARDGGFEVTIITPFND